MLKSDAFLVYNVNKTVTSFARRPLHVNSGGGGRHRHWVKHSNSFGTSYQMVTNLILCYHLLE